MPYPSMNIFGPWIRAPSTSHFNLIVSIEAQKDSAWHFLSYTSRVVVFLREVGRSQLIYEDKECEQGCLFQLQLNIALEKYLEKRTFLYLVLHLLHYLAHFVKNNI